MPANIRVTVAVKLVTAVGGIGVVGDVGTDTEGGVDDAPPQAGIMTAMLARAVAFSQTRECKIRGRAIAFLRESFGATESSLPS